MFNIAEKLAIDLELWDEAEELTDIKIVEVLSAEKDRTKLAMMAADHSNFIVSFTDGSCLRLTFGNDFLKVEVGEDMLYKPAGTPLAS